MKKKPPAESGWVVVSPHGPCILHHTIRDGRKQAIRAWLCGAHGFDPGNIDCAEWRKDKAEGFYVTRVTITIDPPPPSPGK